MAIRWSPETLDSDARYRPDTVRPAVEYAGLVLKARLDGPSFNDGYDCVINALVWDPATGEPRLVSYGSTMGMSGTAEVDATPEALAAYATYEAREAEKRSISAEIRDRKRVDIRGRIVKVVRGRKVPIGTEGVIFWSGPGFERHRYFRTGAVRVGLRTAGGEKFFTDGGNVEVIDPVIETLEARYRALRGDVEEAA